MTTDREFQSEVFRLLEQFVSQRPGLEYGNYGSPSAYRAEVRSITRDLHDFRALMSSAHWRTFTPDELRAAFRAFSGRLSLIDMNSGKLRLEYVTGQYFPTEYRKAACAVLGSLLWERARLDFIFEGGNVYSEGAGDALRTRFRREFVLRTRFRREFGKRIQERWLS